MLLPEDLCQRCSKVDFRVPIEIESKKIHLKVSTSFGHQFCENCPIPISQTSSHGRWCSIMFNSRNDLLVDGDFISSIDLLQDIIEDEYFGMENRAMDSTRNQAFNCKVAWGGMCNQEFMNQVLQKICFAYLVCAEERIGKGLCRMNKSEIVGLEKKIPLNIILMVGFPNGRGIEEVIIEQDIKTIKEK